MIYDIVVIGAGISSLFFLHELKDKNMKILVLEKGVELDKRFCPKLSTKECKCEICSRHFGIGGPLNNEGKFNYTNDFGGTLGDKIGNDLSLELQYKVDEILMSYCKNEIGIYSTYNIGIENKAKKTDLEILTTKVRHLGINNTYNIFNNIYSNLKDKVEFMFGISNIKIKKSDHYIINDNIFTKKIVLATNSLNTSDMGIDLIQGKVRLDIGLRIEMEKSKWNVLLRDTFETKLKYKDSFTYCMNPNGRVVKKIQNGYEFADGQNCNENSSTNLNFTLFYPEYFNSQHDANIYVGALMEKIGNKIRVHKIGNCVHVMPTLESSTSNILNDIPEKYVHNLKGFLKNLEALLEQELHNDVLVYTYDVKYYSPIINTDIHFQTSNKDLYVIGDCSGVTSSLSQAAASGIYLSNLFN